MGSADPLWKMDEKLKSENIQKRAVFYVYVIFYSNQVGVENGAMLTTYLFRYLFRMHHFVVKISKFSSLTKILRAFLHSREMQRFNGAALC